MAVTEIQSTSRIAVVGTGYVGLTTGACFAQLGHNVMCADIDESKVERLKRGEIPIHEEGLESIVQENMKAGRLEFVLGAEAAVKGREFIYLCVPTPQGADGRADLSYVEAAAREIAPFLDRGAVVVNKSTVPVGSTLLVERAMQRPDVHVVSNPEFLREGSAVDDFLNPDRVVIGAEDRGAASRVAALYLGVRAPILITDPASAETCKYAANAFLATKISFANAVAAVCEAAGADVADVLMGIGYDSRIGHHFLKPGPGWGGSCFPKDTKAMIGIAEDAGYDFAFLKGVIEVNNEQFDRVVEKIRSSAGGSLEGVRIGVLGLTFKAGTDDMRDSPSIEITGRLVEAGAIVSAYDPVAKDCPIEAVNVVDDAYAAAEGADVLAILTEWEEFKFVDLDKLAEVMNTKHIVDGRNLLDRGAVRRRGFTYQGIGRS
ncbi:MAG: UDP-glucose/GDP-mannose dehydrogenase family protein [Acidimicrobiia bacterium]|nr:UDP-glucose/GDP-mannose dehydrogenase family protein [Acidimicrobiia bacterium]